MAGTFAQDVYALVRTVPVGSVTSYGQLAMLSGHPRAARIVGCIMAACDDPTVPCHRVLHQDGSLCANETFGFVQRQMLHDEGVFIGENGRVDMRKYAWSDG